MCREIRGVGSCPNHPKPGSWVLETVQPPPAEIGGLLGAIQASRPIEEEMRQGCYKETKNRHELVD